MCVLFIVVVDSLLNTYCTVLFQVNFSSADYFALLQIQPYQLIIKIEFAMKKGDLN